ncbi:MAG: hypothetical protein L6R28_01180 [Planctomycetes bacterium]|nr:hypothetical protein [Planctomycetota bacterium]
MRYPIDSSRAPARYAALLAAVCLAASWAHAETSDKDKKPLFDTWYVKGEAGVYRLTLRKDRTYELAGPGGTVGGRFNASDKELAIFKTGLRRHFEFKVDEDTLRLERTDKDQARSGDMVGELPPIENRGKATYYTESKWRKLGNSVEIGAKPDAGEAAPDGHAAAPAGDAPASVLGTFTFTDGKGGRHRLAFAKGGTFEYQPPGDRKATGTYQYVNGELTLDSGFHTRQLNVAYSEDGLRLSRRMPIDLLKLADPLGEMPPQESSAILWAGEAAAPEQPVQPEQPKVAEPPPPPVAITKPPEPKAPESVAQPPEPKETVSEPKAPTPPEEPKEVAEPAPPTPPESPAPPKTNEPLEPPKATEPATPGAAAQGLAALAGSYSYKPNPLVTERLELAADGAFAYRNSDGAEVKGKAGLEGTILTLTAGDVVRTFTIKASAGALTLTRAKDERPKLTNDLATMSPSVLASAQYEKQK